MRVTFKAGKAMPGLNFTKRYEGEQAEAMLARAVGIVVADLLSGKDSAVDKFQAKVDSGGWNTAKLEKSLTTDYGNFLYTAITRQQSSLLQPGMVEHAFGINNQFPIVSDATERMHQYAVRKYGSFYRYMQFRRGGGSQLRKTAQSKSRKVSRSTRQEAKAHLQKLMTKVQKADKHGRDGLHDGNQGYTKKSDWGYTNDPKRTVFEVKSPIRPQTSRKDRNKAIRAGAQDTDFSKGRTGYFHSGRMAAGLRDNVRIVVDVEKNADGLPILKISGGVKPTNTWSDKEAGQAFKYMSKRRDFSEALSQAGSESVVESLLLARLEKRQAKRGTKSYQKRQDMQAAGRLKRETEREQRGLEEREREQAEKLNRPTVAQQAEAAVKPKVSKRKQNAEKQAAERKKRAPTTRTREERLKGKPHAEIQPVESRPVTVSIGPTLEDKRLLKREKEQEKLLRDAQREDRQSMTGRRRRIKN